MRQWSTVLSRCIFEFSIFTPWQLQAARCNVRGGERERRSGGEENAREQTAGKVADSKPRHRQKAKEQQQAREQTEGQRTDSSPGSASGRRRLGARRSGLETDTIYFILYTLYFILYARRTEIGPRSLWERMAPRRSKYLQARASRRRVSRQQTGRR